MKSGGYDELDRLMREYRLEKLPKNLQDPVYRDGYEWGKQTEPPYFGNPYPYPEQLYNQRLALANKPGRLSESEKCQLRELGKLFDETSWSRWNQGWHDRRLIDGLK